MPVRTQESLQKLFQESRLRQQKKQQKLQQEEEKRQHKFNKQKEMEAYRKASQRVKKALADKLIKEQKIERHRALEQLKIERTISIYHSRYVERFIGEDDLYTSRQELEEAETRGEGKINWDAFDKLIDETKQILNNEKKIHNRR